MEWKIWREKVICGFNNQTLKINQCCLNITSHANTPIKFYLKNVECTQCEFDQQFSSVLPNGTTSFIIDTKFGVESYLAAKGKIFCKMTNYFEDFGLYSFQISRNESCSNVVILKEPEKFWLNLAVLLCIYLGFWAFYELLKLIYNFCQSYFSSSRVPLREIEMDLGRPRNRNERELLNYKQSRIKSLDAFRGIAIILMIFVNYGGGSYYIFRHAPWNGLTIADLVFPWFVWIMGASVVLSMKSNLRDANSKKYIFFKILKRSALLIIFGLILNSGHHENNSLRICGVLQRLGVTYFIVASLEVFNTNHERIEHVRPIRFRWYYCQEIMNSWAHWWVAIVSTIVHLLLTFKLNVPGCPIGYLGPGGLSDHSAYKNCTGGAAGYIDRTLFSNAHMYHQGSFVNIFKPPVPYDPEGILGTFMSIVCAFFGILAARIILKTENSSRKIKKWMIWCVITGVLSGLLCNWSKNDGLIPINKNLWSLSYVLASASLAFLILSIIYWLIDVTKFWNGFPVIYPGMNAIALYLGHSLLKNQLPWRWAPFTDTHFELLFMDVGAATLWLIISYIFYTYNVFITL